VNLVAILAVGWVLTCRLGAARPGARLPAQRIFILLLVGGILGLFLLFQRYYGALLRWCLEHKAAFLSLPWCWSCSAPTSGWVSTRCSASCRRRAGIGVGPPQSLSAAAAPWVRASHAFPGLGREFMPPLDEGSFLWMPTTMPHASIGEVLEVVSYQDQAIASVPEVASVTGKIGRAESALDPAPVSMLETVIHYLPEYITDEAGRRVNFRYDRKPASSCATRTAS
jgi:copper/silver efflux system protein